MNKAIDKIYFCKVRRKNWKYILTYLKLVLSGSQRNSSVRRHSMGGDHRGQLELHHLLRQGRHQPDNHPGQVDPADAQDARGPQLGIDPTAFSRNSSRNLQRHRRGLRHTAGGPRGSHQLPHPLEKRENRWANHFSSIVVFILGTLWPSFSCAGSTKCFTIAIIDSFVLYFVLLGSVQENFLLIIS